MKYGKSSFLKRLVFSPLSILVLICLLAVLTRSAWNLHERTLLSAARLSQAQAERTKLEEHKAMLNREISYLDSEEGVEAELRSKYRAIREGESVAVIIDGKSSTSSIGYQLASVQAPANFGSTSEVLESPSLSWWSRLLSFIGF
jgi:cell division protein FtsB